MIRERLPQRDDRHLLAHPLAECRDLRHLSLARGDHRRAARQHHPRLPHPVPLQQLPRGGRSLRRKPDRPRARSRSLSAASETHDPALSDLDRMAADGAGGPAAGRTNAGRPSRERLGLPPTRASASASSGSTTPRASSTACAPSTTAHGVSPRMEGPASSSSRSPRRRAASSPTYSARCRSEAERLADEINARHGGDGYKPIVLVIRHHEPDEVFELFRAADRLHRVEPARRHEPRRQGIRRRA